MAEVERKVLEDEDEDRCAKCNAVIDLDDDYLAALVESSNPVCRDCLELEL